MHVTCYSILTMVIVTSVLAAPTQTTDEDPSMRCHHSYNKRMRHMRNQIDKLSLRQKIDHIHLELLQDTIQKMQEQLTVVIDESIHDHDASTSNNIDGAKNKASYSHEMPQDIPGESMKQADSKAETSTNRGSKTLAWVVQILPNLQQNIEDLQQSTQLLERMHQQQDSESKIDSLRHDLTSFSHTMAKISSVAESADEAVKVLTQDVERNSESITNLQAKIITAVEEIDEEKGSLDGLLRALPDGILTRGSTHDNQNPQNTTTFPQIQNEEPATENNDEKHSNQDTKAAQDLPSQLVPTQRIIQRTSGRLESLDGRPENPGEDGHTSSVVGPGSDQKAYESYKSYTPLMTQRALSKIRQSSVSLLHEIANVENRLERSVSGLRADLSKVEVNLEQETQERRSQGDTLRRSESEDVAKIRQDVDLMQNDLRHVEDVVGGIEDRMLRMELHKVGGGLDALEDVPHPREKANSSHQKEELEKRVESIEEILHEQNLIAKKTKKWQKSHNAKHRHRHKHQRN